ncbi:outer membrane protein [Telmatobacter bradus]|uniref:outer membrane protein n=1 Tax=Telmatobacter bradus TaxID=474953 RepID=UPI003B432B97
MVRFKLFFLLFVGALVVAPAIPKAVCQVQSPVAASQDDDYEEEVDSVDKIRDHGGEWNLFAGAAGLNTQINGWNTSGILGLQRDFRPIFHLEPSLEVRGIYPLQNGSAAAERSGMGGVNLGHRFGKFKLYGSGEYGRGKIQFPSGYAYGDYYYVDWASNVYAVGGGVDYHLFGRWSIKADYLQQHWTVPMVSTGSTWTPVGSLSVVYRFRSSRQQRILDNIR